MCCINRFTSLCKNLFNLLEFLAEAFRCHVHHFQCLTVLNKFLHSEVNQLIQHIIVQDQDGQNNNANKLLSMSGQPISVVIGVLTWHLGLYGHLHNIWKDINPRTVWGHAANTHIHILQALQTEQLVKLQEQTSTQWQKKWGTVTGIWEKDSQENIGPYMW